MRKHKPPISTMTDLSIIIITWKAKYLLKKCLDSIYNSNFRGSREIIVVDNGSFDGSVEMIKQKYPKITLIENSHNKGVSRARNQGLKIAQGRYCLLLDDDAMLGKETLQILVAVMDRDQKVGIGGPKLLYPDGQLQYSCRTFPTPITVLLRGTPLGHRFPNNHFLRKHLLKDFDHNSLKEVDSVLGACMIIRKETVKDLNYLDEGYFFAYEDTDLCLRAWKRGWTVLYIPQAQAIHCYQRRSVKSMVNRLKWEHIKSASRFFWKKYFIFKI